MYTDAGHVVDTLIHILNSEQEFFRDYVRTYEAEKAEREFPLIVTKGMFNTRPREVYPLLEIEPNNEENKWGTTRAQRSTFNLSLRLTVANSSQEYGVEYITGWVRRIKIVLNDPRRLQAWITNAEGKREYKYTLSGHMIPLGFLDSMVTGTNYRSFQGGTLRQAELSWFCLVHESLPAEAFVGHWPHYTQPMMGAPNVNAMGDGRP